MNRSMFAVLLASIPGLVGCASQGPVYEEKPITHQTSPEDLAFIKSEAPLQGTSATLWVNGLGCPLCASNIDLQLKRLRGVTSVNVDLSVGKVEVGVGPGGGPSPAQFAHAVEDAGFTLVKVEPH